jgi:hypothetical protein
MVYILFPLPPKAQIKRVLHQYILKDHPHAKGVEEMPQLLTRSCQCSRHLHHCCRFDQALLGILTLIRFPQTLHSDLHDRYQLLSTFSVCFLLAITQHPNGGCWQGVSKNPILVEKENDKTSSQFSNLIIYTGYQMYDSHSSKH